MQSVGPQTVAEEVAHSVKLISSGALAYIMSSYIHSTDKYKGNVPWLAVIIITTISPS